MKLKKFPLFTAVLLASASFMLMNGCKEDDAVLKTVDIKFSLKHNVDGQALVLNEWNYANPFGRSYKVTKLRYYVSDFKFNKPDGTSFETDMYRYVNFGTPATFEFTVENVPEGDYESISFIFGLDEEKNVDGGIDNTLENINMEWPSSLGDGYHYMQLEGFYKDSASSDEGFNTHMGIKKVNDSTFVHNFISITLQNSGLTLSGKNLKIELGMNINEWYHHPVDYDFPLYGQAIMLNPDAQQTLHENGADIFSVESKTEE